MTVNGEIYNHRELREQLKNDYEFQTGSNCEVILALYRKYGVNCVEKLNGIFGFALYDEEKDRYLIARDPMKVIPLSIGYDDEGHLLKGQKVKSQKRSKQIDFSLFFEIIADYLVISPLFFKFLTF